MMKATALISLIKFYTNYFPLLTALFTPPITCILLKLLKFFHGTEMCSPFTITLTRMQLRGLGAHYLFKKIIKKQVICVTKMLRICFVSEDHSKNWNCNYLLLCVVCGSSFSHCNYLPSPLHHFINSVKSR